MTPRLVSTTVSIPIALSDGVEVGVRHSGGCWHVYVNDCAVLTFDRSAFAHRLCCISQTALRTANICAPKHTKESQIGPCQTGAVCDTTQFVHCDAVVVAGPSAIEQAAMLHRHWARTGNRQALVHIRCKRVVRAYAGTVEKCVPSNIESTALTTDSTHASNPHHGLGNATKDPRGAVCATSCLVSINSLGAQRPTATLDAMSPLETKHVVRQRICGLAV